MLSIFGEMMFGKHVIRLGDPTTHGGVVVSASSDTKMFGKEVACLGDHVTCPIKGHGSCVIAEGDPTWTIDGRHVALEGHKTSCGASLISTLENVTRSYEGMGAAAVGAANTAHGKNSTTTRKQDLQFDEQLRFVSAQGLPYANIEYVLTLGNDSTASGRTDEKGRTERIATDRPVTIQKAEFFSEVLRCCEKHRDELDSDGPIQVVDLSDVKTNSQDIGSSLVTVAPENEARPLTAGEIEMARPIFRDALDYSAVRVHKGAYLPGQNERTAMTPNGEMYFLPKDFQEDFSILESDMKMWFVHELVHVWQYQLGYSVRWNGLKIALKGGSGMATAVLICTTGRRTKTGNSRTTTWSNKVS